MAVLSTPSEPSVYLFAFALSFLFACRCPAPSPGTAGHYEAAGPLRHALYEGDLVSLRHLATELDGGPDLARVGSVGERAELALHGAAGFLVAAADGQEAGEGLAAVGRSCGDCHRAAGVVVPVVSTGLDELASGQWVQQHSRVADVLWWALVAADSELAERAVALLKVEPIVGQGQAGGAMAGDIMRAAGLAEGGGLDQAQAAFAVLAGSCAPCHATVAQE